MSLGPPVAQQVLDQAAADAMCAVRGLNVDLGEGDISLSFEYLEKAGIPAVNRDDPDLVELVVAAELDACLVLVPRIKPLEQRPHRFDVQALDEPVVPFGRRSQLDLKRRAGHA